MHGKKGAKVHHKLNKKYIEIETLCEITNLSRSTLSKYINQLLEMEYKHQLKHGKVLGKTH